MVPSPSERRSFLRGMRQGRAVAREMSSGNQVRVGQWGATSRTCFSSSLSLHSVCASRLTRGNAYLCKARGQLCASASVPRGPSVREKYSWQWEDSGEANRSTWASPKRLQISCFMNFLNVSIEQFKYHFSWLWYAIIKKWYSKTTWTSSKWYLGRCWTRIRWSCQKTIWFYCFMNF